MPEAIPMPRSRWLLRQPDPGAAARLFCVPYSGCGASMYHAWPRQIADVEICPVQLPGRENRIGEPSYTSFEELALGMIEGLRPYLDRPFGLFGHCASALACYETAVQLSALGGPQPTCLFVSSQVAPHEGPYGRFLTLSDDELGAELVALGRRLGGDPHPELLQLSVRTLRTDIETHRRYQPDQKLAAGCPIVAIGWSDDREVPARLMPGWRDYGTTTYHLLPGTHYQFLHAPPGLLNVIAAGFTLPTDSTAPAGRNGEASFARADRRPSPAAHLRNMDSRPQCVEDYRRLARGRVSPAVWEYVEGGAGAEATLAANVRAFRDLRLQPRVLVDVSTVSMSTTLLGTPLAVPIGVAPMAYQRLVHPDGELGSVHGANEVGALAVVSIFASQPLADLTKAAHRPLWLQLYWLRDRDVLVDLLSRAADVGIQAIVLTLDTPRLGRRLRDLRNDFAVDPQVRAVNLDAAVTAVAHERRTGESSLAVHAAQEFDQTITWADLAWLRGVTDLPLVVKGILTAEDAARAVAHGVDAIVVSNHGGRQLDGVPPTRYALPAVVEAVADAVPVLVDGGIRSGGHVFAALALGAAAVLVGRPVLWALACGGGDTVADLLRLLRDELELTMALAGRPTLADIDRTAVA